MRSQASMCRSVRIAYIRTKPSRAVLGYVGTVSDSVLKNPPAGMDYESGDEVGQSGVESVYDGYLSGAHGERVVVTDADGVVHEVKSETPASQGNDVYLTISARVQSIAEQKLKELIAPMAL